jgi:hypothetical protein
MLTVSCKNNNATPTAVMAISNAIGESCSQVANGVIIGKSNDANTPSAQIINQPVVYLKLILRRRENLITSNPNAMQPPANSSVWIKSADITQTLTFKKI